MASFESFTASQTDLLEKLIKAERNFRKTSKDKLKKHLVETRLELVEELWSEFKDGHKQCVVKATREQRAKDDYFIKDIFDQFQEIYVAYKCILKETLYSLSDIAIIEQPHKGEKCDIKLPRLEIPKFNGKYSEWQTFYDMFLSVIHNNSNLAPVQKLHYLKSSLSGEPETLIRNFSTTEANYKEAWAQLIKRYNNKKYNCNSILQVLFSQNPIQTESSAALKQLLDTTTSCLKSLNNMNVSTDSWDAIIIYLVVSKLDRESHRQWESQISIMTDELPLWSQLVDFLESRFRSLEMIEGSKPTYKANTQVSKQVVKTKSFHTSMQEERKHNLMCSCCNGSHHICHCKQFGQKSVQDRYNLVQEKRLCYNCLGSSHSIKNCRQTMNCRKCGKRHHSLLHNTKEEKVPATTNSSSKPNNLEAERNLQHQGPHTQALSTSSETHIVANFSKNESYQSCSVLLATAVIKTTSKNGNKYLVRALLDQASQGSFVTEATVQLLGLKRKPISGWVSGLSDSQTKIKHMVSICVESSHNPNKIIQVNAYVLSALTSMLPTTNLSPPEWPALRDVNLADPTFASPGKIDILLGAEVYSDILLDGIMKHPQGNLLAQNTILGWIISGRVSQEINKPKMITLHLQTRLDTMLKQFWEVENEPPSIKKKMSNEELICEKIYESTTVRQPNGRFIVKLPFRTEDPECQYGNHQEIATKRLNYLETKLNKKPDLYKDYKAVIQEYLTLDHMKLVSPENRKDSTAVYLPHHAVIRNDKSTSKVRVVFDGSCKGNNQVALNDDLLVGPKLQQDLRHLLMRWRNHKICITADLVKMYRQVQVAEEDTKYQRILWRSDPDQPIEHYYLTRLTFGTACAPYLAVKTIQRLADDEKNTYPLAAEITKRDFYIDDLMTGCQTETEAIQIYKEMNNLMNSGGFQVQKWSSNNKKLLQYIDKDYQEPHKSMTIKPDNLVKVLGICWNRDSDNFEYVINLPEVTQPCTKRQILSDIARLYDPLGWIAPVVVVAKLFIQKLWKSGIDWDEALNAELSQEWLTYRKDLTQIQRICIPRWVHFTPGCISELHVFCDASQAAYAANVYLRVVNKNNEVTVNLITAKTKVAPIEKEMSIPRLELSGAALAAKLLGEVSEVMGIPKKNTYAWTDSTVVLAWLKGPACRWTTFVSNRVSEILTILDYEQWNHVTTDMNPADCASRGLKPADLKHHALWLHGPKWLQNLNISKTSIDIEDTHEEEKPKSVYAYHNVLEEMPWERFSSLMRMLKVLSYCRRMLNLKQSDRYIMKKFITTEEMKETLTKCIIQIQNHEFKDEIFNLKRQGGVLKRSALHPLCPFLDHEGLLRVGGRIELSETPYNNRHPIILPSQNHITKLLIADAHMKTMHGGPQLMLNHLRGQYWILRARQLVKKYYRECVICIRQSKANRVPFMGQIPAVRLKPNKPFKSSGVDYAGPINIRFSPGRGSKSYKGYICLFVCMVTHAIHLEAVSDLTAKGFIAAFKRMTARRGHCQNLYSDNGTNFTGADKILHDMFNNAKSEIPNEIAQLLTLESTTWHFMPPQAPNFGGLWEAGVRLVKTHLRKVIGESTLTYEELSTVLTQVEACVNSRPLTSLSDDVNDPLPLTPGHFLVGEPLLNIVDDVSNVTVSLSDRWRLTSKMVKDFWNRWSVEYLVMLNNRYKWTTHQKEPKINDIVIIKEQNLPPAKWLLGKIVETHPGPDKIVRVVTIKTKNGLCKRPCSKLCFLPQNTESM